MQSFLMQAVFLLFLIVLLGFFNEKITKMLYEISLMLFSIIIGIAIFIPGLSYVWKYYRTDRSDRCDQYFEEIQSSERYQFHHGGRITL